MSKRNSWLFVHSMKHEPNSFTNRNRLSMAHMHLINALSILGLENITVTALRQSLSEAEHAVISLRALEQSLVNGKEPEIGDK